MVCDNLSQSLTRQVYNLFQEPVEQAPLGFSIAEEKIRQFERKLRQIEGKISYFTTKVHHEAHYKVYRYVMRLG